MSLAAVLAELGQALVALALPALEHGVVAAAGGLPVVVQVADAAVLAAEPLAGLGRVAGRAGVGRPAAAHQLTRRRSVSRLIYITYYIIFNRYIQYIIFKVDLIQHQ